MAYFIKQYKTKTGTDVSKNNRALGKLRREVETAKRTLPSQLSTRIEDRSFRERQRLLRDLDPSQDTGVKKEEIDDIVLVGGSARIPKVQQLLKEYFGGKEPSKGINPDAAVAYGAAVQGGVLSGEEGSSEILLIG
ncbi:ATPase with role in protein import into the ER [Naganishia albida]|nr:ATPase with role in protein import into the ER [Naganishia albida]